jgi:hypothetical protein
MLPPPPQQFAEEFGAAPGHLPRHAPSAPDDKRTSAGQENGHRPRRSGGNRAVAHVRSERSPRRGVIDGRLVGLAGHRLDGGLPVRRGSGTQQQCATGTSTPAGSNGTLIDEVSVRIPAVQGNPLAACLSLQAVISRTDTISGIPIGNTFPPHNTHIFAKPILTGLQLISALLSR